MKYELHPLCTLFPRLEGDDFNKLRNDIQENGLRQPIVIHDGMILDGGNRYKACLESGVEPKFIEYDGDNIASFVLSMNMHRRHLSQGQYAAIVSSMQKWNESHPPIKLAKDGCNVAPLSTVADRAAQSGASIRTQQMADKVAKADPELAKKVAHGEISLPKAVEKISPKKPELKVVEQPKEEFDEKEQTISEQADLIVELEEENQKLKDALAIGQIPEGLEIEDADSIIDGLRKRNRQLEIQVKALTDSRDSYLRENAQLKEQIRRQSAQLKKMGGAINA